jgi:hypothetical protein
VYKSYFLMNSLLECFFVCAIFKAELCRISGANPIGVKNL